MKQWIIPVVALLVGAGIAAGAILYVTGPWQSTQTIPTPAPTAAPKARFTAQDIERLAQQQVSNMPAPAGANFVRCVSASYRPDADMWVVTCDFAPDQAGQNIVESDTYTVSDKDGKLQ